jgi:hypothetical protein
LETVRSTVWIGLGFAAKPACRRRAPKNQGAGQLALAGAVLPLLISVLLKLAAEAEARKAIIRQRQPKAKN